jgi:RNA polymerase sigma-70 factor (ECF subfamily)
MSATATPPDELESWDWLHELRAGGATADAAIARLHALLLRAARFEVARRRAGLPLLRDDEDVALEAADDALVSCLEQLDQFGGASRFTTWASKFAVVEAAVKLRRRDWRGRELPSGSHGVELPVALQAAMSRLTPEQLHVLVALALNGVPIDVLAERLNTSRSALYETLHEARRTLRQDAAVSGLVAG